MDPEHLSNNPCFPELLHRVLQATTLGVCIPVQVAQQSYFTGTAVAAAQQPQDDDPLTVQQSSSGGAFIHKDIITAASIFDCRVAVPSNTNVVTVIPPLPSLPLLESLCEQYVVDPKGPSRDKLFQCQYHILVEQALLSQLSAVKAAKREEEKGGGDSNGNGGYERKSNSTAVLDNGGAAQSHDEAHAPYQEPVCLAPSPSSCALPPVPTADMVNLAVGTGHLVHFAEFCRTYCESCCQATQTQQLNSKKSSSSPSSPTGSKTSSITVSLMQTVKKEVTRAAQNVSPFSCCHDLIQLADRICARTEAQVRQRLFQPSSSSESRQHRFPRLNQQNGNGVDGDDDDRWSDVSHNEIVDQAVTDKKTHEPIYLSEKDFTIVHEPGAYYDSTNPAAAASNSSNGSNGANPGRLACVWVRNAFTQDSAYAAADCLKAAATQQNLRKHTNGGKEPPKTGIVGHYDYLNSAVRRKCRLTRFSREHWPTIKSPLEKLLKQLDEAYRKYAPIQYALQRAAIPSRHQLFDTVFSTVTVNDTFRTAMHRDSGDFRAGFGVLALLRGSFTGCYLAVPAIKKAFALRPGDVMLFDTNLEHGNTEAYPDPAAPPGTPWHREVVVCYLRVGLYGPRCEAEYRTWYHHLMGSPQQDAILSGNGLLAKTTIVNLNYRQTTTHNAPINQPKGSNAPPPLYVPEGIRVMLTLMQESALSFAVNRLAHSPLPQYGAGCVLAMSMGLGKSLVALCIAYNILVQNPGSQVLIVTPKTILSHWIQERDKWAREGLRFQRFYVSEEGGKETKMSMIERSVMFEKDENGKAKSLEDNQGGNNVQNEYGAVKGTVIVVNPQSLNQIAEVCQSPVLIIADEGHTLANRDSSYVSTLDKYFTASKKVVLTGTPLQNNVEELYQLISWVNPAIALNNTKKFFLKKTAPIEQFVDVDRESSSSDEEEKEDSDDDEVKKKDRLIDDGDESHSEETSSSRSSEFSMELTTRQELFQEAVSAQRFLFEWMRGDVYRTRDTQLPTLHDYVLLCQTGPLQRWLDAHSGGSRMYGSKAKVSASEHGPIHLCAHPLAYTLFERYRATGGGFANSKSAARLATAYHSQVFHCQDDQEQQFSLNNISVETWTDLLKDSGKIHAVLAIARIARDRGERVVIFSQYLFVQRILLAMLRGNGVGAALVDGSMNLKKRGAIIENFVQGMPQPAFENLEFCHRPPGQENQEEGEEDVVDDPAEQNKSPASSSPRGKRQRQIAVEDSDEEEEKTTVVQQNRGSLSAEEKLTQNIKLFQEMFPAVRRIDLDPQGQTPHHEPAATTTTFQCQLCDKQFVGVKYARNCQRTKTNDADEPAIPGLCFYKHYRSAHGVIPALLCPKVIKAQLKQSIKEKNENEQRREKNEGDDNPKKKKSHRREVTATTTSAVQEEEDDDDSIYYIDVKGPGGTSEGTPVAHYSCHFCDEKITVNEKEALREYCNGEQEGKVAKHYQQTHNVKIQWRTVAPLPSPQHRPRLIVPSLPSPSFQKVPSANNEKREEQKVDKEKATSSIIATGDELTCQKHHVLKPYQCNNHTERCTCSGCQRKFSARSKGKANVSNQLVGCSVCKFYLCQACARSNRSAIEANSSSSTLPKNGDGGLPSSPFLRGQQQQHNGGFSPAGNNDDDDDDSPEFALGASAAEIGAANTSTDEPYTTTCLILSTKTGAFGIDLTCANHVILFDSWWNPQVDAQAVARCHRRNQQRPVTVYRLVGADTVEEHRILRAQQRKLALFQCAVDGETAQAASIKRIPPVSKAAELRHPVLRELMKLQAAVVSNCAVEALKRTAMSGDSPQRASRSREENESVVQKKKQVVDPALSMLKIESVEEAHMLIREALNYGDLIQYVDAKMFE